MKVKDSTSRVIAPSSRPQSYARPAVHSTPASVKNPHVDTFSPPRPQVLSLTGTGTAGAGLHVPQVDLRRGQSGTEVRALQDVAVKLGYMTQAQQNTGPGVYGPRTEAGVKAMQTKYGLPATGVLDAATRTKLSAELDSVLHPQPQPPPEPPPANDVPGVPGAGLARGAQGAEVQALQNNLVKLGYLTQDAANTGPGIFGPKTENAVRALQSRNELPVTGQFDEATRAAMVTENDQLQHPEQMVQEQYQRLLGRAPTAAELSSATAAATGVRDAGGTLRAMRDGLSQQIRSTPEYLAAHPLGNGAVSSTEDADNYFLTQWGPTPFNSAQGAPYGYSDCGPTSTAMALASLGLLEHPDPANAEATIDAVRDAAFGYDTTTSQRMGFGPLQNAVAKYGGTTQMLPPPMVDSIDAALERGNPVVIGGDPWQAWGSDQRAAGNYLNSKDPGGHFVTVLGKTADGSYIVGDPLVKGGTITVTAKQLETFFGSGFGAMEVSRP